MALQPYTGGEEGSRKRKNILTGHAEEVVVSDITFNTQHRKFLQRTTALSAPIPKRQKGDASDVHGFKGPWAKWEHEEALYEEVDEDEVGSDEEVEYIEEGIVPNPTAIAPMPKAATAYAAENEATETTEFHGSSEFDYQGRTYMHVPQDLDIGKLLRTN